MLLFHSLNRFLTWLSELVGRSTTLVQTKLLNYLMNCHEILYEHSWSSVDEAY